MRIWASASSTSGLPALRPQIKLCAERCVRVPALCSVLRRAGWGQRCGAPCRWGRERGGLGC